MSASISFVVAFAASAYVSQGTFRVHQNTVAIYAGNSPNTIVAVHDVHPDRQRASYVTGSGHVLKQLSLPSGARAVGLTAAGKLIASTASGVTPTSSSVVWLPGLYAGGTFVKATERGVLTFNDNVLTVALHHRPELKIPKLWTWDRFALDERGTKYVLLSRDEPGWELKIHDVVSKVSSKPARLVTKSGRPLRFLRKECSLVFDAKYGIVGFAIAKDFAQEETAKVPVFSVPARFPEETEVIEMGLFAANPSSGVSRLIAVFREPVCTATYADEYIPDRLSIAVSADGKTIYVLRRDVVYYTSPGQ
jgi:hypothetical protein